MQGDFAERFGFLNIVKNRVLHHAILLPSIYAMHDCKLLLEYLSFKSGASCAQIIASPDCMFCTQFTGYDVPLKIDGAKQVIAFSQMTALEKYKIIVIEDFDNATNNALNALLKTLEEPSQNTVFYLLYSNQRNIPSTIASRCYLAKENITNEKDFSTVVEFFVMKNDFGLFVKCGYDLNIYQKSIASSSLDISNILIKLSSHNNESSFIENAMLYLERTLRDILSTTTNFTEMTKVECLIKKFVSLRSASEVFNTNKHANLIELTERVHELVS